MVEDSTPSGSGQATEPEDAPLPASHAGLEEVRARLQAELDSVHARLARFEQSTAGRFWSHLSATDFMNSSFAFGALAVISAFPFLAVSSAAVGGDVRHIIVGRMGLNAQATNDVAGLIGPANKAVSTLTWVSAIILLLGGIGMCSTLMAWYARIFEQPPPPGVLRHLAYQAAGVFAFTFYILGEVWLFDRVRPIGGAPLIFFLTFVFGVLSWWWSAYMLLYRQVPLRRLFPAGLATGLCILGLGIVSHFVFSGQVTSGQDSYGPAGVVIAIITFLVGYAVCIHAGAVFGRMWNEWQDERAALDQPEASKAIRPRSVREDRSGRAARDRRTR
jgi:membrane protein